MAQVHLTEIIPGGVLPTDHWHRDTNDETCSRCRREVPDEDVPLRLWKNNGRDMLIYCEACLGVESREAGKTASLHRGTVGRAAPVRQLR